MSKSPTGTDPARPSGTSTAGGDFFVSLAIGYIALTLVKIPTSGAWAPITALQMAYVAAVSHVGLPLVIPWILLVHPVAALSLLALAFVRIPSWARVAGNIVVLGLWGYTSLAAIAFGAGTV